MPDSATTQQFTRTEALRYLGITERTLRSWERQGLVDASESYTLQQLVALRTLVKLRAAKLPSKKIQAALAALRLKLREVKDPLTELRLYAEGNRIRVQLGPQHMEPESGQLLFNFNEAEIERMILIPSRREENDRQAALDRQRQAEKLFLEGLELEQHPTKMPDAIAAYQKAVSLDPQLAAAYVNLGTLYFGTQQYEKAANSYRRALSINPDYPLAHFNMGNLYDELGDTDQAQAHYQSALKLDPNYADAHYNLALLFQSSGKTLKAVRHWQTYLKLDSSSAWASIARRELDKLSGALVLPGTNR